MTRGGEYQDSTSSQGYLPPRTIHKMRPLLGRLADVLTYRTRAKASGSGHVPCVAARLRRHGLTYRISATSDGPSMMSSTAPNLPPGPAPAILVGLHRAFSPLENDESQKKPPANELGNKLIAPQGILYTFRYTWIGLTDKIGVD